MTCRSGAPPTDDMVKSHVKKTFIRRHLHGGPTANSCPPTPPPPFPPHLPPTPPPTPCPSARTGRLWGTFIGEEEEELWGSILWPSGVGWGGVGDVWGWGRGLGGGRQGASGPSHGLLKPPGVFAEVDVDSGFFGVTADARTPRDDPLESPVAHERSPGVTLKGQEEGWGGVGWGTHGTRGV